MSKDLEVVLLIGGGLLSVIAPSVSDAPWWWTVIGVSLLIYGFVTIWAVKAHGVERNSSGGTKLTGPVSQMRDNLNTGFGEDPYRFWITVSATEFEVTSELYNTVSQGDDVVLTVRDSRWVDIFLDRPPETDDKVVTAITRVTKQ